MKEKYNKKVNWDLYFYRENKGREIDIVKEAIGPKLELFEIKSSKTFNKEFTKNLKAIKEVRGDKISSTTLIYDGENYPPDIINIRDI